MWEKFNTGDPYREYDHGKFTGNWICIRCYSDDMRKMTSSRSGNLNPNSSKAIGDLFQEITCRSRSLITGTIIKDLNIENDCFNSPLDHSIDPELGILQTKGRRYGTKRNSWQASFRNEHGKEFDNLIFYYASIDLKIIIRVYIFPYDEIMKRMSLEIFNNNGIHWYDRYRVDEKVYDDNLQNILKYSSYERQNNYNDSL